MNTKDNEKKLCKKLHSDVLTSIALNEGPGSLQTFWASNVLVVCLLILTPTCARATKFGMWMFGHKVFIKTCTAN